MATFTLHYLFDPLCGWCYASAPALARLADVFPEALQLNPTGLFAGPGARTLDAGFAQHARSNDQRIAALTGQPFSDAYYQQILGGQTLRFDSMPMSRVLTLARDLETALEPGLFHHLQRARYVDGQDTSQVEVVAQLSATWLSEAGHGQDAAALARHLVEDRALAQRTAERIEQAQALMAQARASGVPLLLVQVQGNWHALSGSVLYGPAERLIDELRALQNASA